MVLSEYNKQLQVFKVCLDDINKRYGVLRNGKKVAKGTVSDDTIRYLGDLIRETVKMLISKVPLSVKSISAVMGDRDLSRGEILKSKSEVGSVILMLE